MDNNTAFVLLAGIFAAYYVSAAAISAWKYRNIDDEEED